MIDVVKESRNLKSRAMDARDLKKYDVAVEILKRAEDMLRDALNELKSKRGDSGEPGKPEKEIANQLVHILGSKGGVLRRWGKYTEAADSYDAGYDFERKESGYGIINSYTLIQRLVTRVFLNPNSVLDECVTAHGLPVRQEFLLAKQEVQAQLEGPRSGDPYAQADLAMACLLLGDLKWEDELDKFEEMEKDSYAIDVTHEVLNELREVVVKSFSGSNGLTERITQACKRLEKLKMSSHMN